MGTHMALITSDPREGSGIIVFNLNYRAFFKGLS